MAKEELNYTNIDSPYNNQLQKVNPIGKFEAEATVGIGSPNQIKENVVNGETMSDMWITNFIRSKNYSPGVKGFNIDGMSGDVEFGNGKFRGDITGATGTFNGSIVAGSIHIPDKNTTADSFHVQTNADTWWGCTETDFNTDNNNAKAYILKTGAAKFQEIILGTNVVISGLQAGTAIDGQYLDDLSVTTDALANLAITAEKIDNATITATQIADATITATQIANATITGTQIDTATITAANIVDGTITGTQIDTATITAANIVDGTITGTQIDTATITGGNIASGTITTTQISDTAGIVGGQIDNLTITAGNIANLTITASQIANTTITGMKIAGNTITGNKLKIGNQSWSHDIVFSSTDSNTVSWNTGTITMADGSTTYSIDAGNTGNMVDRTYIYLDIATSTTILQITTTAGTAVGDGKILIAVAENSTTEANFQVYGGIGGITISGGDIENSSILAAQIASGTITANEIASNTITASEISVGTITATEIASNTITAENIAAGTITGNEIAATTIVAENIAANTITSNELTTSTFVTASANIADGIITNAKIDTCDISKLNAGTINSKIITLDFTDGVGDVAICCGKTDFGDDVSGFILGIDDSDSNKIKFEIGETNKYLKYDPTNGLRIRGIITIENPEDIDGSTINNDSGWTDDTTATQAIEDAANAQATADGKIITFYQNNVPTATSIGDLWIDTNDGNKLYRAESVGADQITAGEWVEIQDADIAQAIADAGTAQATADSKIVTFFQNEVPTATDAGDLWFDTNDKNKCYRATNAGDNQIATGEWEIVRDTDIGQAITDAANAQSAAETAQATADGKVVTFYQDASPTAEGVGDLWVDTNDGNKLYRWSGSVWTEIQDAGISQAISDAAAAQSTADGKIVTFYQDNAPTAEGVGDIWFDTDDKMKQYRWSGSEWVSVVNTDIAQAITDAANAQATADGKIITFYQDNEPTSGESSSGDLWIDTNDGNKLYRYSGTAWIEVQDTAIQTALTNASNAQTTADGKIVTFYQDNEPTAEGVGDIWVDTNDNNKPYRWSGSVWEAMNNPTDWDDVLDSSSKKPADNADVTQTVIDGGLITTGYITLNAAGNIKGGQTDFNTGVGFFLGYSGDYKFSVGNITNYLTWDGTFLKLKGSFDVGSDGVINNSVYTVANLPTAATIVGFNSPSGTE